MSPTSRRILLAFVVALVVFIVLGSCASQKAPPGVDPVQAFEVERYMGKWFEVARLDHSFERGLTHVTAEYALRDDGKVTVINRGYSRNACRFDKADGVAKFQGAKDVASLSVTFFWPFYGGYHVFDLGDDYSHSLISGPSTKYLWILSREPELDQAVIDRLVEKAKSKGFPVHELIYVEQGPLPDCDQ